MISTNKKPMYIDEKWNLSEQENSNLDRQTKNTGQQDGIILNTASVHLDEAHEYYLSKIRSTDMI